MVDMEWEKFFNIFVEKEFLTLLSLLRRNERLFEPQEKLFKRDLLKLMYSEEYQDINTYSVLAEMVFVRLKNIATELEYEKE